MLDSECTPGHNRAVGRLDESPVRNGQLSYPKELLGKLFREKTALCILDAQVLL